MIVDLSDLSDFVNQVPGLCLAVGGLCTNLEKCGHPSVRQHSDTLSTAWLGLLYNQVRLAILISSD